VGRAAGSAVRGLEDGVSGLRQTSVRKCIAAVQAPGNHGTVQSRKLLVAGDDPRYLELATKLLQRMRLASPDGGVWEAADVQWWHREYRPTDQAGHLFWLDEQDEPIAAFVATDFWHSVQCDVLLLADDPGLQREVWRAAIGRAGELGVHAEFVVRPDDSTGVTELAGAGYTLAEEQGVLSCWLDAPSRQPIPALAPGYRVVSRVELPGRPHALIARNGSDVESRLRECSLYRPDLDLTVEAPDGQIAGYGLFWPDPVTGVGLIEPIRTEQAHQGLGIASHLIAVGIDGLAAHGCRRMKVANDRDLYQRAGFRPLASATAAIYTASGATGHA
jgi:GNAT superfamily N-acetyltransferase